MAAARFIIGLVLLLILAGLSVWVFIAMQGDDSKMISYALGNETDTTVDIHIEVTEMMSHEDTYPYSNPESGQVNWPLWAEAHYVITDPSGNVVRFQTDRRSNLVTDAQHHGFTVLFIKGTLNKNTDYTFNYIPVVGQPEQFVRKFTTTPDALGRQRVKFMPVH